MKVIKKIMAVTLTTFAIGSFFSSTALASNQVFVDGYKLNHAITKDGRTYVQLNELVHYTNYQLEYDSNTKMVNFYKNGAEKPIIKREYSLFPVNVEEVEFENRKEIVKVYELSENESPSEISKEPFEKNGYKYELSDITKSSNKGIDIKPYEETVTVNTNSQDTNTILKELQETKEYKSDDGYSGVLKLDIGSVQSGVKGYKNSSYNISETREYPNLSSADTSLVPKTISLNGKTLKLANVNWQATNNTTVDYEQLADTYTAVATYTGTGTKSSVTGYTTTAIYRGEISKEIQGKTIYTAYFLGTKIENEPIQEPTAEELEQQLKELKIKEKQEKQAQGEFVFNPMFIIVPLSILSVVGGLLYIIFLRKNVTVYTMIVDDGKGKSLETKENFKKIGKTRITKKEPIIDLTPFTSKVTTPSFIVVLDRFISKPLNDKTVTINYGGDTFGHVVTLANDDGEKKKDYQIEVDF